ncbi:MAG: hypothetical protein AAGD25_32080 [Cyanobacteria bacterium P01_F01_bin.150]
MKHTSTVKGFDGTNEDLAHNVGDLFYDSLSDFLKSLSEKIKDDGEQDLGRGRKKLAKELHSCSIHLAEAAQNIDAAWDICEPYVDQWFAKRGITRGDS